MPYGTLAADTLQSSTGNTAPVFRDGNSVEIGKLCKGFINFQGSNSTVGSSFNISSITRSSAGVNQVNMTMGMVDVYYTNHYDASYGFAGDVSYSFTYTIPNRAFNYFTFACANYGAGGTRYDSYYTSATFFR